MDERSNRMHPWVHRLRKKAAAFAVTLADLYDRTVRQYGRDVKGQMIRGVSYGVGSGAVSILVVWWQNRH
ncbi:hypothetical protein [Streptomyces sp. NPDC002550]